MATCASCRSEVAEKDFFCWNCGKPWKGAAVGGTFEEQVYDEYAMRMREEYVRDRKVRAFTLFGAAGVAGALGILALLGDGPYRWFYVALCALLGVGALVRGVANWRTHVSAKSRLDAERGRGLRGAD